MMATEMYGVGEYKDRQAQVWREERGWVVILYKNGKFLRDIELFDKSEHYAEDVAENWTNGIIKE